MEVESSQDEPAANTRLIMISLGSSESLAGIIKVRNTRSIRDMTADGRTDGPSLNVSAERSQSAGLKPQPGPRAGAFSEICE
jgi:hypothetical protein